MIWIALYIFCPSLDLAKFFANGEFDLKHGAIEMAQVTMGHLKDFLDFERNRHPPFFGIIPLDAAGRSKGPGSSEFWMLWIEATRKAGHESGKVSREKSVSLL